MAGTSKLLDHLISDDFHQVGFIILPDLDFSRVPPEMYEVAFYATYFGNGDNKGFMHPNKLLSRQAFFDFFHAGVHQYFFAVAMKGDIIFHALDKVDIIQVDLEQFPF